MLQWIFVENFKFLVDIIFQIIRIFRYFLSFHAFENDYEIQKMYIGTRNTPHNLRQIMTMN